MTAVCEAAVEGEAHEFFTRGTHVFVDGDGGAASFGDGDGARRCRSL